jgi:hypothetical protein
VGDRVALVWAIIDETAGFLDDGGAAEGEPTGSVDQARVFLQHLFTSKVSIERRAERPAALDEIDHGKKPEQWADIAGARTILGASLLGVLYESTRCLGNVIATGAAPVTNWLAVAHPGPAGSAPLEPNGGVSALDALEADGARRRATRHLKAAAEIALYLHQVSEDERLDEEIAEEHGLELITPSTKLTKTLNLLKIESVRHALEHLEQSFRDDGELTGALIEWLADLFWHLMVTGSRVPPSQAQIAFYVNLHPELRKEEMSAFSRAGAGEVRGPEPRVLSQDIRSLLETYDSGIQPRRDKTSRRAALSEAVAACVLEQWNQRARAKQVIVLSTDFDLSFERTLLELSPSGDAIHLVVPVWHTTRYVDHPYLDWLFTTIERTDADVTEQDLVEPRTWGWYAHQPPRDDDEDPVHGPIVVKLNGSPLMKLKARPEGLELSKDESVEIATVFTEYDSLQAIISFAEAGDGKTSLASDVVADLQWQSRSWVVLGDSFPHWLPRVRLIYSARSIFRQSTSNTRDRPVHIAIDRSFGWPEKSLLEVLGIGDYAEDLSNLSRIVDRVTTVREQDRDVSRFFGNVRKRLDEHKDDE